MQKKLAVAIWLILVYIVAMEVIIATNMQNSGTILSLPVALGSPNSNTSIREVGVPVGALALSLLAIGQAIAVLLFYMDLRHHSKAIKLTLLAPFLLVFFLLIMMVLSNVH